MQNTVVTLALGLQSTPKIQLFTNHSCVANTLIAKTATRKMP